MKELENFIEDFKNDVEEAVNVFNKELELVKKERKKTFKYSQIFEEEYPKYGATSVTRLNHPCPYCESKKSYYQESTEVETEFNCESEYKYFCSHCGFSSHYDYYDYLKKYACVDINKYKQFIDKENARYISRPLNKSSYQIKLFLKGIK